VDGSFLEDDNEEGRLGEGRVGPTSGIVSLSEEGRIQVPFGGNLHCQGGGVKSDPAVETEKAKKLHTEERAGAFFKKKKFDYTLKSRGEVLER